MSSWCPTVSGPWQILHFFVRFDVQVCVDVDMMLMLRQTWGGVGWGWDVDVHVHLQMMLMLRHVSLLCVVWGVDGVGLSRF